MRSITLLLFFLAYSFLGMTQNQIEQILEKTNAVSLFPDAEYVVIFDSTTTDVQETGLSHVWNHKLYQVVNTDGAKELAVLKFGYDPQSAFVSVDEVNIYRANGQKETIDVSLVMDYPAPARAIYWGAREKMIEVGRLEPGDAVEVMMYRKGFTYALLYDEGGEGDERYIPPMKGHFYDIVEFYASNPIVEKVYRVKIPLEKTLQFEFYHGEVGVSGWINEDKYVYTFNKKDIKPIKREANMVAYSDVAPKLLLSTSPDWYAKSTWFFGVNEDFGSFESTPEIDAKVREILQEAENEEDSITLLTHWCGDEIRYSGISMGEGEGFTLHKGEMTFTDRCGVCKDKAGMLITMLRAAGFESYPAMTMAGSRIDYIPADQFNHCVTVVKRRNGQYQLLDPTWVPFLRELWSSAEQQQQYLMGVPEGADLATTPISDPENHYVKLNGTSVLRENGTLEGEFTITAEGQSDGSLRRYFQYYTPEQWNQNIERELLRIHPKAQVTNVVFNNPMDYLESPITLTVEYIIPDYARVTGNTLFFTPLLAQNPFRGTQSHLYLNTGIEERQYPFRDRCSRKVEISEVISLPPDKTIVRLPESIAYKGANASIDAGYDLDANTLIFTEDIVLEKRIYEAKDWDAVRKVVTNQKRFADKPIILK
jgi:hypothetical protein